MLNIVSNVGRLLFNYPHSYTTQSPNTLLYIASIMFLVVPGVLAVAGLLWRMLRQHAGADEALIGGVFLVAFGGSSLVAASPRYCVMLVPLAVAMVAHAIRETRILEWTRRQP